MKGLEETSRDFFRSLSNEYVEGNYLPENDGAKEAWNAMGYHCFREQARKNFETQKREQINRQGADFRSLFYLVFLSYRQEGRPALTAAAGRAAQTGSAAKMPHQQIGNPASNYQALNRAGPAHTLQL